VRLRATILVKLLVALVIPAVALFALFAVVAYEVSKRDLDDELGHRLEAIAASAATQIRGKYLVDLKPGDEGDRAVAGVQKKLEPIAQATGVHLFVFDRNYEARFDSAAAIAIGTPYFRAELDRSEIDRVFATGESVASVTFDGSDGRTYKSGYAPVRASETEPQIVLALGAQAPASYFTTLDDLRVRLLLWGAGLAAVSVAAAVLASLLVTRNVRRLATAAERIGAGDLRAPVVATSRDELGVLAEAMDHMRQQLAERDARMQQMLAGIAHEVRNPLAGMTLFAGFLRDELPDGDERRGHVDKIQRELGYLERVVNDFLEYARRPKPELADVALADVLAEVAQLATTDKVTVSVVPTELHALVDRGQLRRAVLNLAKNAVQASTDGMVRLAASEHGDETHLAVSNRGKEISPETSGKLFEPFYTTREKGTGLGLAFVREIVADHGGRIDVTSADGETTFTISVPTLGRAS
jgi:signal transduction histidine kinase